jgi:hypothetical protein
MYSGMTFGLGLFFGSLASGWLAGPLGLPRVFQASAVVALVAIAVFGRTAAGRPRRDQSSSATTGA